MDNERKTLLKRVGLSTIAILIAAILLTLLFTWIDGPMGTMYFSLLAGALGAVVSIIQRIPKLTPPDIDTLVASYWSLVIPLLTGAVMAGFLFLAFMAGILTGDGGEGLFTSNLFPNFTKPETGDPLNLKTVLAIRPVEIKDFGKLLVWCFLSGYSERLVPSIMRSLEQRGSAVENS